MNAENSFLKNVYNLERDKRVIIAFVGFVATYK